LVFHFGNTNTGTGGAFRFPKTGSNIGCSFLSRQYQKQTLSKNGKQVLLIFEYIPVFRFSQKWDKLPVSTSMSNGFFQKWKKGKMNDFQTKLSKSS